MTRLWAKLSMQPESSDGFASVGTILPNKRPPCCRAASFFPQTLRSGPNNPFAFGSLRGKRHSLSRTRTMAQFRRSASRRSLSRALLPGSIVAHFNRAYPTEVQRVRTMPHALREADFTPRNRTLLITASVPTPQYAANSSPQAAQCPAAAVAARSPPAAHRETLCCRTGMR